VPVAVAPAPVNRLSLDLAGGNALSRCGITLNPLRNKVA
jgi:hypothetical protein